MTDVIIRELAGLVYAFELYLDFCKILRKPFMFLVVEVIAVRDNFRLGGKL